MRITSYKLLLFIMTLLCGSIGRTEAQSVTKIELGGNSMLQVGTNATITATVSPSDAANKALKWESSNVGVVEIVGSNNNNAFIKAYSTGSAWITATAQDGSGVAGSIRITVVRLINKIILGIPGSFLDIGVTTELPVRVEPSDATGKDDLNWDTSNPDVISVTSTGQITTHKTGTAVITATAKDGSGVSGQLAIKVHRPVRKVIIDGGDITLKETERKQLTATIQPADASVQSISWRTDDQSVATVTSSGYLIAKGVGKTTVTAWSDDRDGGFPKGSVEVTVEPYENKHTPVESVAIREGNQDLKVNDVKRLTAVITPDNATNKNMTWASSKADIASVSANGLVKAHKAGEATVTVTTVDGSKTATCKVIVQHITNANVEVGEVFAVWSENGRLHIDSPATEMVDIYSINGRLLGRIIKIPGKVAHDLHLSSQSVLIVRGSSGWTRKIKL